MGHPPSFLHGRHPLNKQDTFQYFQIFLFLRLVQRMGRTGRKRAGKIIVLVTQGKEENTYNQSMYSKNSIDKALLEKNKLVNFLSISPRLVPAGIDPVCHKMAMKIGNYVNSKSGKSR